MLTDTRDDGRILSCREEIEQVRRDRDQKPVADWDHVEQVRKRYPRLKRISASFAGWEEAWVLGEPVRVVEWARAAGQAGAVEWARAVIVR